MKKVIIPMLFLGIALFSCKKENGKVQDISVASLPQAVVTYVANNYPAETIYKAAEVSDGPTKYVVTLTSDEEITFDHHGGFIGEGEYHGQGRHHGDHHGEKHHHDGVPSDSLSSAIQAYIATNFAGYTIRHAEHDSICSSGLVTEVMIFKSGSEPLKLYFSEAGEYLMQGTRVSSVLLPQAVKTVLSANYAGYTVSEKSEKYTLADNFSIDYFVFIRQDSLHKHLIFRDDGTLICSQ